MCGWVDVGAVGAFELFHHPADHVDATETVGKKFVCCVRCDARPKAWAVRESSLARVVLIYDAMPSSAQIFT